MSKADFHSPHQVMTWLQNVYEIQKKGKLNSNFDIKNHICYEKMPSYQELISSDSSLCFYAAKLFNVELSGIQLLKKRFVSREHCQEVNFEIANETQTFFIKRAWEGAIKEAIGLEFNNLLTDTPVRYLCGAEVIITEKVFDPLPTDTLYELRESDAYQFAFGAWEIFTRFLRLTDRKTTNVRWNGKRLANIDFGLVFYKGKPVFDSRFTLTKKSAQRTEGQHYALRYVLSQLWRHQTQFEQLLLNLDVHFCRSTPCSRTPREPLRVILTALKEIEPDVLADLTFDSLPEPVTQQNSQPSFVSKSFLQPLVNFESSNVRELLSIKGMIYTAVMNKEGKILDEIASPQWLESELKQTVLNHHLLALMTQGRNHGILKSDGYFEQSESIQLDLTGFRLLLIWNETNHLMGLSLVDLETSIAHLKITLRKAIENVVYMPHV